jgi:NADPH:quinone reductase-like Zn-dependent oxidoreductase
MKSIIYTTYGSPDVLHLEEAKMPAFNEDQVLVKAHAASIDMGDYLQPGGMQAKTLRVGADAFVGRAN